MGSCGSRDETDRAVQREIEKDKSQESKVHKLLLLGAGGSGKSTFFKQLKTIHGDGHSAREKEGFKRQINGQIIESMQIMIRQCKLLTSASLDEDVDADERTEKLRAEMGEKELAEYKVEEKFEEHCKAVLEIPNGSATMTDEVCSHIKVLWKECPAIRKIFDNRNKICVPDSTGYFLNELDRIGSSNYVPDTNDILFVRYRTTGMTEKEFRIKDAIFKVHDVGGQRSERKKWINFFDGVTAVLFVVSLTCYDEVPFEDVTDLDADVEVTNNMAESIKVFKETIAYQCFNKTGFILFFNKADLMKEKVTRVSITGAFPDYKGPNEFQPVVTYIQNYFMNLNDSSERETFAHITTATDTKNVEKVFEDVQQCVINLSLKMAGLV